MLLAWSVIFLHGIIPHNHHDHRDAQCHNILHHDCSDDKDNIFDDRHHYHLASSGDDNEHSSLICHFTSELVNSAGQDHAFIHQAGLHLDSLPIIVCQYISVIKSSRINKPALRLMPLRAPPLA
ncbi:MAG: hypothetical protein U5K32_13085 [Bacteroidales bacterium]|nr:hypothetical protein [Bacteroidales bacterium]